MSLYWDVAGILAVETNYDRLNALFKAHIPAIDILLMLASAEGDLDMVDEVLQAGAVSDVKDIDGKTALMLAGKNNPDKKLETAALINKHAKHAM